MLACARARPLTHANRFPPTHICAQSGGGALRPGDIASSVQLMHAIASGFATLLNIAESQIAIKNITDIATGVVVAAAANPAGFTSRRRRLAGAAGSQGVSVSIVAHLGKTPTEQATLNMQAALAASGAPQFVALQASITRSLALATTMPASYFAVGAPTSASFANSPFVAPASDSIAAGPGSGSSGLGAGLGVAAGVAVLACGLWCFRSWSKHGVLPCNRDRSREVFRKRAADSESVEISNALAEAERALVVGSTPLTPKSPALAGGAGSSKAMVVRRLLEKSAREAEEVAALKKELLEAKALKANPALRATAPTLGDGGEIDYDELDKAELLGLAAERDIDVAGLKVREMRKRLQAADEEAKGRRAFAPQAAK